jgi:hypothetical protein
MLCGACMRALSITLLHLEPLKHHNRCMLAEQDRHEMERDFQGDLERDTEASASQECHYRIDKKC